MFVFELIISPNEVFGDIMVLASLPPPPPRPPRRREHSNSKSIQPISFKFDMRVDTPWGTLLLKFDTLRGLEQLSQPNDTCIPQISNWNISISNGPIAFKFYTEVKNPKLHNKMSMTRLTPKLHSLTTLVSPKSSKCNISMNNGPIALKFCTGVLWARWVILSNVRTDKFELDIISLLVNFSCELGQRMTRYDFLWARWVILSNVRTDLNLT